MSVAAAPLTGPEAIEAALKRIDLDQLERQQHELIRSRKISKRPRAVQVLNVIEGMRRNNYRPEDLLIQHVPVIPPVFRPFSVVGNTFVPGDANELYRDLIQLRDTHEQLKGLVGDEGSADSRLALYNAVKAVYGQGEPVNPKTKQRGVAGFMKMITGTGPKWSYAQRKLLSKPMDNVGRSTIAVDPELSLDEIGVPWEMGFTAYSPHIMNRLVTRKGISQGDALKNVKDRTPLARQALEEESRVRPVIYSRAPAWHKFNTLAAHPRFTEGATITINPLVTTGMNADFDGDQMNIHVPAHPDSVKEAYEKLLPSRMLFSIKDPDRVVPVPKHEQVLGLFTAQKRPSQTAHRFKTEQAAMEAIHRGDIALSDEVQIG